MRKSHAKQHIRSLYCRYERRLEGTADLIANPCLHLGKSGARWVTMRRGSSPVHPIHKWCWGFQGVGHRGPLKRLTPYRISPTTFTPSALTIYVNHSRNTLGPKKVIKRDFNPIAGIVALRSVIDTTHHDSETQFQSCDVISATRGGLCTHPVRGGWTRVRS